MAKREFEWFKNSSSKKKWTIMIYANGNNELEPEIYERFLQLKKESINNNINIIVQLGRAPGSLVELLRPKKNLAKREEWSGVRRYLIKDNHAVELDDLGNINMADPNSLSDFVIWGMKKYPSTRNMVIMSGHGAGFVGVMTDYMQDYPYMMNIQGLTSCLYKIKEKTGKSIDCMLLDTCYMNMVEVWYEISMIPNNPIKHLLVTTKNVALEGLPYHLLIRYLHGKKKLSEDLAFATKSFNKIFVRRNKLQVVKLNKKRFRNLKKEVDLISKFLFKNKINLKDEFNQWCHCSTKDPLIGLLDLEDLFIERFSNLYFKKLRLKKILGKIIIYPELTCITPKTNQGPALYLPRAPQQYATLKSFYKDLLFLKNSSWLAVLGDKEDISKSVTQDKEKKYDAIPPPIKIPLVYVVGVIMDQNPEITFDDAWNQLQKLNWNKFKKK
ncbi:clostripain-related cysteine peptidase [Serpentinicella sp. ANB-PHB4]|uniref:clostripain-related cysteine peptidase n=1 Tax=Serpentinicella sp. ANB-PHB4 TaxID=3074076 RepID=UPI00285C7C4C|nr:clostripain-related cysteine peptidase [Serpentinicella sp. ANB-PHB4]MDR5658411.1 clostripain-related cysteine peptidase [Serpentinicella sp. ANB-PHB4]